MLRVPDHWTEGDVPLVRPQSLADAEQRSMVAQDRAGRRSIVHTVGWITMSAIAAAAARTVA